MFLYCKIMMIDPEENDMLELGVKPSVVWGNAAICIADINFFVEVFDDDDNAVGTLVKMIDGLEYDTNLSFNRVKKEVESYIKQTTSSNWLVKNLN